MRRAAVALAAAILCSGCGGDSGADRLVLEFTVGAFAGQAEVTEVVDCVARPQICGAVSARRAELLPPLPKGICAGGVPFATLRVTGRLGERIDRGFGNCEELVTHKWIGLLEATVLEVRLASSGRTRTMLISCSPSGGTVADPPASCRELERDGRLFPPRRRIGCGDVEPGSVVTAYGYLRGQLLEMRNFLACREPATVQAWTELLLGFHRPAAAGD